MFDTSSTWNWIVFVGVIVSVFTILMIKTTTYIAPAVTQHSLQYRYVETTEDIHESGQATRTPEEIEFEELLRERPFTSDAQELPVDEFAPPADF